ncbi:hypothetical protein LCM4579_00010 [Ensifer sp. LCM 4579]|nr:hypothetical protein LCM4579_00010 [Ensifer sp. LCM 4579]
MMRQLSAPKLNIALTKAVNDSAVQVERKAESLVAKTLSIPAKRAKLGIWIRPRATPQTLTATVRGSASEIPLKAFHAKEVEGGVVARIWGSAVKHPGAFIFGGPDNNRNRDLGMGGHVFHRLGKTWTGKGKRGPIARARGGKISEAMAQDAVSTANERYAIERLQVNVLRQLDRATRRRGS